MRRLLLVVTVMAVMAAMMVASAMPAFAQIPPPPKCENGQFHASTNAINRDDFRQSDKHAGHFVACSDGVPPGHFSRF